MSNAEGSDRSIYSSNSTKGVPNLQQKEDLGRSLFKEKDTINYAEPDGKILFCFLVKLE
jgi:hypothetical protein